MDIIFFNNSIIQVFGKLIWKRVITPIGVGQIDLTFYPLFIMNTERKKTFYMFLIIKIVLQSISSHPKSTAHIVPQRSVTWQLNTHHNMSLKQATFFHLFKSTSAWFGVFHVDTNETISHRRSSQATTLNRSSNSYLLTNTTPLKWQPKPPRGYVN